MVSKHDELARLARANPVPDDALWESDNQRQMLYRSIVTNLDRRRPAARRRLQFRVSLVLALIASLVLVGAAYDQRTYLREMLGTPIEIDDIPARILDMQRVTPLPPGNDWEPIVYPTEGHNYPSEMFEDLVQAQAMCKWMWYWQDARGRNDVAAESASMATIQQIPTWKFASHRDPSVREGVQNNPLSGLIDAAVAGDPGPLDEFVFYNCHEPGRTWEVGAPERTEVWPGTTSDGASADTP